MNAKAAIESLNSLTAYTLAGMADSYSPDSLESVGAQFLTGIRDAVVESLLYKLDQQDAEIELSDIVESWRDGDDYFEVADSAPSIYNHQRMLEMVDLGAYLEDVSEFGESPDVLTAAGYALYAVARRLVDALLESVEEFEPAEVDADNL